jgi:hypothetical protein
MTRTRLAAPFLLVALLFLAPPSGGPIHAQAARGTRAARGPERAACSLATLQGNYGVLEQGTFLGPIPGAPAPPFAYANAVNAAFDGRGNLTGTFTASFGGVIQTGSFSGTYEVNADCTYSDHFVALGIHLHHVGTITGDGMFREAQIMYTNDGVVATGTAKRVSPSGCSPRTIDGSYTIAGQGTVYTPLFGFTPPIAFGHVGSFAADGEGYFAGQETLNLAGIVLPNTYTATYTVTADCTAEIGIKLSSGVLKEVGVVTGVGPFQEFRGIIAEPGWVFAEFVKRQ